MFPLVAGKSAEIRTKSGTRICERKIEREKERETNAEYNFRDWPSDTLIRNTNTDVWITCITHIIYGALVLQSDFTWFNCNLNGAFISKV